MTPTDTNLPGVMKHPHCVEYGYLGDVFGWPAPEQLTCAIDGTLWESAHWQGVWWLPEFETRVERDSDGSYAQLEAPNTARHH
jgi:hypothetical protein